MKGAALRKEPHRAFSIEVSKTLLESDKLYLFNCINNLTFGYANQNFLYFRATFEKVFFW